MSDSRVIQLDRSFLLFPRKCCHCIGQKRGVITHFNCIPCCRLHTRICGQADHDHTIDAMLPQYVVNISVRKCACQPVLLSYHVPILWREVRMKFPAPSTRRKYLKLRCPYVIPVQEFPIFVVTLTPPPMGCVYNLHTFGTCAFRQSF